MSHLRVARVKRDGLVFWIFIAAPKAGPANGRRLAGRTFFTTGDRPPGPVGQLLLAGVADQFAGTAVAKKQWGTVAILRSADWPDGSGVWDVRAVCPPGATTRGNKAAFAQFGGFRRVARPYRRRHCRERSHQRQTQKLHPGNARQRPARSRRSQPSRFSGEKRVHEADVFLTMRAASKSCRIWKAPDTLS